MGFYGDSDIDVMLRDFGLPIVHGTESGNGLEDEFSEDLLRGADTALRGKVIAVLVKSSAFPTLAEGSPITINGAAHTVRHLEAIDDGALTRLLCKVG